MPYKTKEARRLAAAKYRANWSQEQRETHQARTKSWRTRNAAHQRHLTNNWHDVLKEEVLTHYGKDGQLACSHPECLVADIDMLTIDHIDNDGARHRKEVGRRQLYHWLRKNDYPAGFQTLCMNHNFKKELQRKRK